MKVVVRVERPDGSPLGFFMCAGLGPRSWALARDVDCATQFGGVVAAGRFVALAGGWFREVGGLDVRVTVIPAQMLMGETSMHPGAA